MIIRSTRNEVLIRAPAQTVYDAFLDPKAIGQWLAPNPLTGEVHSFTPGVGGGFVMSLYPPSADGEAPEPLDHRFRVQFEELVPGKRIVERVRFESENAANRGGTRVTVTFKPDGEAVRVTMLTENIPNGVSLEDNRKTAQKSLEKLQALLEAGRDTPRG